MTNFQSERAELAHADRHIADANRRVGRLIERITENKNKGWDTTEAERLLSLMHEVLDQWHAHRRVVLVAIARGGRLGWNSTG
ncbi:hypothetical protein [Methylobacterium nonmethylotrophicum]|uniref:Uncharacterized protein n=1 Tax=Methylobacterium nonmethylotrophicum TaxID=1141884 RepID=A0A4Z0NDQ5_9HYPH|nr:hypothetical protein [Methylobacterium nonmethylotrophicum]TGD93738.1 hypothetical protein EU555_33165 [Methylobacterium nonmethylotrophicum]